MNNKDTQNRIIIGALIAVIVLMGVVFAAFSSSLKVNGTATIASEWKITYTAGTCTATSKDTKAPSSGTVVMDGATANITANMSSPGDILNCTITVKNEGTLPAKRSSFSVTTPLTKEDNYTVAVSPSGEGEVLAAKAGDTVKSETLTVTITYKAAVTTKPTANETFKATATYVQAPKAA